MIYTVINQPHVEDEDHSSYAQNITREILKEVLEEDEKTNKKASTNGKKKKS